MPNPQPGGPGYSSSSGSYPLICPAWVTPTSSYATAGIALRVSGALKPHHDKVETPSVGYNITSIAINYMLYKCLLTYIE
jgi:hypothetical protein